MKKIAVLLLFISSNCVAQNKTIQKIAEGVSIAGLKKNLYYLASDNLEGRLMASHGDTLASLLVADWFKKHKITAPYGGGNYFQAITAQRVVVSHETIGIVGKIYHRWDGWIMPNSQTLIARDIPVIFIGYGLTDSLYDDLKNIDVRGKAVILLSRQPKNKPPGVMFKNTSIMAKLAMLKEKGAIAALRYDEVYKFEDDAERSKKHEHDPVYINKTSAVSPLPSLIFSEDRINELLLSDKVTIRSLIDSINNTLHPVSFQLKQGISIDVQTSLKEVHAPNVIGIIYGTDTASGCVLVTAHHDHLGKRGTEIYHGARDNASGTVALMEMAALMNQAVSNGFRPKRSIVFISTTGEEGGDLGSFYYSEHPLYPLVKTYADINLDVLGRPDDIHLKQPDSVNYIYVFLKTKDDSLKTALEMANRYSVQLKANYTYKDIPADIMLKGDTYPFLLKDVPCISFFTGVDKDAVQPGDTADKINYQMLARQTRLAFLTLWNIANQ